MNNKDIIVKAIQEANAIEADMTLKWGVLGSNGHEHLPLIGLASDHLENIIVTQAHITPVYKRTILEILKNRK